VTAVKRRLRPQTVRVEQTRHSGVLYGPVRVVHPAITQTGSPYQYDGLLHAYRVPLQRLDDVLAAIELDGHHVDMRMPGWS
jgi:hypothetical protein